MAVYRNVQIGFWQDHFVLNLTPEERYFYLYLLTCSKTTQCGIYQFPIRLVEAETGYKQDAIEELLQRFINYGKIVYNAETQELYIKNWVRYNRITNKNIEKCVLRELKAVKDKEFVHMFLQTCLEEEMKIPLLLEYFGIPEEEPYPAPTEVSEMPETNKEIAPVSKNVFAFYEQNFGTLSPYTSEELAGWIEDLSEELVLKALQIAHENNKRTLAYVKGILRDWHGKGYTTLREVEEATRKFRKKERPVDDEVDNLRAEYEEWRKSVPSEEELQKFLQESGWRP
ncbi:DnaD domain-containing protein [Ectobacillus panaciterrae]|uniref:DnaD domain-containing protein n=1 Tax=Ectobacillus panaciterrae TaxID=363872 RepID=UPI00040D6024|nr:DnaD domain protein [Ectobacillus panaciterrae]